MKGRRVEKENRIELQSDEALTDAKINEIPTEKFW